MLLLYPAGMRGRLERVQILRLRLGHHEAGIVIWCRQWSYLLSSYAYLIVFLALVVALIRISVFHL